LNPETHYKSSNPRVNVRLVFLLYMYVAHKHEPNPGRKK